MGMVKVEELRGAALDWAVAQCEGNGDLYLTRWNMGGDMKFIGCGFHYAYSTQWELGGPIIQREKICLSCPITGDFWDARGPKWVPEYIRGDTPLIAAMRCYVSFKFDIIDVPNELLILAGGL